MRATAGCNALPVALLALLACTPDPAAVPAPAMSAHDLLVRASLDLRGVRPSVAELDRVEADPGTVDDLVAGMLDDPRFPGRVRELWTEVFRTRVDGFMVESSEVGLDDEAAWVRSVGEEPLRVLEEVARADLPWNTLVTADWTMANTVLAGGAPVALEAAPAAPDDWVRARYTDGRPAAGVLATVGWNLRYTSTLSNMNRGRANAAARVFLCQDFLSQPIDFTGGVDLRDAERVRRAIAEDPACVACHHTLDPLASHFYGFWAQDSFDPAEALRYHPERERAWRSVSGVSPGYFGAARTGRLDALGRDLAADPRFARCAVDTAWSLLVRAAPTQADESALVAVRERFVTEGATPRALVAAVVASDAYRAGPDDRSGASRKLVTPDLLADQVEDLTGFRWTRGGADLLAIDAVGVEEKREDRGAEGTGFRTLAGGADGDTVVASGTLPSVPLLLVQARLAEGAASFAVGQAATGGGVAEGAEAPSAPSLFEDFDVTVVPPREDAARTVQGLYLRVLSRRVAVDAPEVTELLALWDAAYAIRRDPREAWTTVLTALLRDPSFLVY